jgi:hypothetical protein
MTGNVRTTHDACFGLGVARARNYLVFANVAVGKDVSLICGPPELEMEERESTDILLGLLAFGRDRF